jgi:hypothetical protein
MTTAELIEYLEQFDGESKPIILVANTKKRLKYKAEYLYMLMDCAEPVLCATVGEATDMNTKEKEAVEQDEKEGNI